MRLFSFCNIFLITFISWTAFSNPRSLSVSGYLENTSGPVTDPALPAILRVGNGTCFPYRANTSLNVQQGYFSVDLEENGIGSPLSAVFNLNGTTTLAGEQANGSGCSIGGGASTITDFSVHITVGGEALGLIPLRSSAFSHFAQKSNISGHPVSDVSPGSGQFLRFSSGAWTPAAITPADIPLLASDYVQRSLFIEVCAANEFVTYNGTNFTCDPATGSAGITSVTAGAGVTVSNSTGPVVGLSIGTNAISSSMIQDGAINDQKILDSSVITSKIADGSVTSAKLAPTGVPAGTYGSATQIPTITVDESGRITSATQSTFNAILSGDVTGTSASSQVERIQGRNVTTMAPGDGDLLRWNGGMVSWENQAVGSGPNRIPAFDPQGGLIINGGTSGLVVNGSAGVQINGGSLKVGSSGDQINRVKVCFEILGAATTITELACTGISVTSNCQCSKDSDNGGPILAVKPGFPATGQVTAVFSSTASAGTRVNCVCYN